MVIAPSVTTNGEILAEAMRTPARAPHSAATTIPVSEAVTGPAPPLSRLAMTTVVSATDEPTDRSMPPETMTMVIPADATATTTV
jgi:hypothetical protein